MSKIVRSMKKALYFVLLTGCLLPFVEPAMALFVGLGYALLFGQPFSVFNKKMSGLLLKASVVGLGFGMELQQALASGKDGMYITLLSVFGTLTLGIVLTRWFQLDKKTGYLVGAGTAICGGSAIAAVGLVIKASDAAMSVSLATIFILNAVALFVFPTVGRWLNMSQADFGTWAAIAIHDTSSVVGATSAYGMEALQVGTLVKLTRALWIIPVSLVSAFVFKSNVKTIQVPWFIFLFVLAMLSNSFLNLPDAITSMLVILARKGLTLSLFFIGASLSMQVLRSVGLRPMLMGVLLWIIVAVLSLMTVIL